MISIEKTRHLWGIAAVSLDHAGNFRDAEFLAIGTGAPPVNLGEDNLKATIKAILDAAKAAELAQQADFKVSSDMFGDLPHGTHLRAFSAQPQQKVANALDAHLRLQALSRLVVLPRSLNLDNLFAALPLLAFTSHGPILPQDLDSERRRVRKSGQQLIVQALDKFPPLLNYMLPEGVRIGDGARVRLGAHLAPGTVIMHEGFCNFNAGTLGQAMIEGRISAGVVVGEGSDLGGSASIMGTLSGGNNIPLSLGKHSLIGANAGLGIPLGNGCTVEAGLYITAGTRVALHTGDSEPKVCKASELAFSDNLLFRRNSQTGAVEVLPNTRAIELNQDLHSND